MTARSEQLTDPRIAIRGYRLVTWKGLLSIAFPIAVGLWMLFVDGPGKPVCEGKLMRPGDLCLNGSRTESYASMMAAIERSARAAAIVDPWLIGLLAVATLSLVAQVFLRHRIDPPETVGPVSWHGPPLVPQPHFTALAAILIPIAIGVTANTLAGPAAWYDYLIGPAIGVLGGYAALRARPKPPFLVRVDEGGLWVLRGARSRWIPWPSVRELRCFPDSWTVRLDQESVGVNRLVTDSKILDLQLAARQRPAA